MRVREEHLAEAVRPIKVKKGKPPKNETIFYTMQEKAMGVDDEGNFLTVEGKSDYAKRVIKGGQARYYIKRDGNSRLFDPHSLDDTGKRHVKFRTGAVSETEKYSLVNLPAFLFYLKFLRTKNKAHYICAEREAL
jgi:hypothetical protein